MCQPAVTAAISARPDVTDCFLLSDSENPGGSHKQTAIIVGCVLGFVVLAAVTAAVIVVSR